MLLFTMSRNLAACSFPGSLSLSYFYVMYMHCSRFQVRICNELNAQPDHWMCFLNTSAQTQCSVTASHPQTRHRRHRYCTSGKRTAISPDCVMYRTHGNDGYCNWHGSKLSAYALFPHGTGICVCHHMPHYTTHRARHGAISQTSRIPEAHALYSVPRVGEPHRCSMRLRKPGSAQGCSPNRA